MSLRRVTSILALSQGIAAVIAFAGIAVLARFLPESDLGYYFIFESSIWIFSAIGDFGLRDAIEKRMSEGQDPSAALGAGIIMKIPLVLIVVVFILVLDPILQNYISQYLLVYLPIAVILHEGAYTILATLSGEHQANKRGPLKVGQYCIWVLMSVGLLIDGWGVQGVVLGWMGGYMFIIISGIFLIRTRPSFPNREMIRSLGDFGVYTGIGSLASIGYNWADILLIGAIVGPTAVAHYEVAWRVSMIAILLPTAIRTASVPEISRLESNESSDGIRPIITKSLFFSLLIPIPMTAGVIIVGSDLLTLLFGSQYATASTILVLLCLVQCINAVGRVAGPSLQALDRPKLVGPVVLVALFLNVILNIILVYVFGTIGAAIATGLSTLFQSLIYLYMIDNLLNLDYSLARGIGSLITAAGFMTLVTFTIYQTIEGVNSIGLIITIIISSIVYFAVLLLIPQSREHITSEYSSQL